MVMTSSADMAVEKPRRLTRAEQRARTRAALIDAAGRVIAQRGFHGASIEAITAEAGYTGGAFYANFDSKEDLFAELLEQRVFKVWREILTESAESSAGRSAREIGEISAAMNRHPDSRWVIGLWLELMANAGRDERFRKIAAQMWREGRALSTHLLTAAYQASGRTPPAPPEHLVSAMMALETGLSLQHYADPEAVPLELIPELFELLFGRLEPRESQREPSASAEPVE
jgi:AcrR family transcriptional regulator